MYSFLEKIKKLVFGEKKEKDLIQKIQKSKLDHVKKLVLIELVSNPDRDFVKNKGDYDTAGDFFNRLTAKEKKIVDEILK